MATEVREIRRLQVSMGCDRNCEPCSKYFDCTSPFKYEIYKNPALRRIQERLAGVKYKIAVMSGKGGVGKSTTTCNLGAALSMLGAKVGLLDSDFYGPSVPTIMGVGAGRLKVDADGIVPVVSQQGIKVASVASTLTERDAITWMGDQIRWALYQFLGGTSWGELDFLLVDLPPGTGEETLNVMKAIQGLSGGVVVTIPSEVSQIVVGRGISLCQKANTRVIGVIENMGTMLCPHCGKDVDVFMTGGGKMIAERMGVPYLGTVPLDHRVAKASDEGMPFVLRYPDSEPARGFAAVARKIAADVGFISEN
ncbi:MAG: ATP-binding protein [Clostridia bacterium]|nr:MAG: ATP-binding protein [Clostridia bacterium]